MQPVESSRPLVCEDARPECQIAQQLTKIRRSKLRDCGLSRSSNCRDLLQAGLEVIKNLGWLALAGRPRGHGPRPASRSSKLRVTPKGPPGRPEVIKKKARRPRGHQNPGRDCVQALISGRPRSSKTLAATVFEAARGHQKLRPEGPQADPRGDLVRKLAKTLGLLITLHAVADHALKIGRTDLEASIIKTSEVRELYFGFNISKSIVFWMPNEGDRACSPPEGYVTIYEAHLRSGLRLPFLTS
ncbi:hypothetical protein Nepgr_025182 [Nepenthes gracilis]|uniref:Uncharacterized protein n=1 Tax=Nepenthes gracilis TaxID=150966 RepID=A0AAD3Y0R1_NEPGR|nr:hypothetical protein Nepgr_025182 [Nepenthes gracilis]